MTSQSLAAELSTLIQDSKRKSPEIRTAAEKSLADLKSLSNTSEAQLAADLRKRPHFATPFVLSCASKNPKFASTSITCLQRLVVSNGLAQTALKGVLDGLRDCTSLAQDIQLKILQLLPSLLQNYANLISNDLLAITLQTCFLLLASKSSIISHTSAATLQQLVVSVFDKVQQEDGQNSESYILDVPIEDGDISIQQAALDAYRLLTDLCLLGEGRKPEFLQATSVQPNFCIELIETIVTSHADVVAGHPELVHVLRLRLMPYIIRALSDRLSFSTTVRCMRLLPLILGNMLSVLVTECGVVLTLLNHMLDIDASVLWKRVLCMEVIRSIHAEFSLARSIFLHFDAREGQRNIIQDQMSLLVRVASEKPSVIGLSQQSTIPATDQKDEAMDEMAALHAEGISGTIGVAMTLKASTATGISTRLSSMRVPCLEQLDKSEAPQIPPAYIYSLVLICLNCFSEGVAKFLLPFTGPNDKNRRRMRAKDGTAQTDYSDEREHDPRPELARNPSSSVLRLPINPLTLEGHVLYSQIDTSAKMVDTCWPALLAAYSTFLHAALDHEHYRDLVRSFQKFTQISGLLRYLTPRDAFLTALSKNAVPFGSLAISASNGDAHEEPQDRRRSSESQSSSDRSKGVSDVASASLNSRNLLCLRALLNLGIALGPVLETAWKIVLGTLQQIDVLITHVTLMRQRGQGSQSSTTSGDAGFIGDIGDQINAVSATAERLFDSTVDLPVDAYIDALGALCSLFRDAESDGLASPKPSSTATLSIQINHKGGQSNSSAKSTAADPKLNLFVIEKLGQLVQRNDFRYHDGKENGWELLMSSLQSVVARRDLPSNVRLQAARTLTGVVDITTSPDVPVENLDRTRLLGLTALIKQLDVLYPHGSRKDISARSCEAEIHSMLLETLHTFLEHHGETLSEGWPEVFSIINSVYVDPSNGTPASGNAARLNNPLVVGSKVMRTAFASLQLICSDFLAALPTASHLSFLHAINSFCRQQDDFNISLTSTTLFCNASEYLWLDEAVIELNSPSFKGGSSSTSTSGDHSKPRTWYDLLQCLVDTTVDDRAEIRRGAVHSVFRILDSCSTKISPGSRVGYLRDVILPMLRNGHTSYQHAQKSTTVDSDAANARDETTIMILEGLPNLFGSSPHATLVQEHFPGVWKDLVSLLSVLLGHRSLNVSAAIFLAVTQVLSETSEAGSAFETHALLLWSMWEGGNPVDHHGLSRRPADNQAALLAYTRCFAGLYPQVKERLSIEGTNLALDQLKICIAKSSTTTYASDIESLTSLQQQVIADFKLIDTARSGAASSVADVLSSLCTLVFDRDTTSVDAKGPTFVAFSKAVNSVLEQHIVQHRERDEIRVNGALSNAIGAMNQSIRRKYTWEQQGKEPQLWKKSTQTLIGILKAVMPQLDHKVEEDSILTIWHAIIDSCIYITKGADKSSSLSQQLFVDESFDKESFLTLYDLIVPRLGSLDIVAKIQKSFANALFENSLVHEPHPDDLPLPDQEPFEGLTTTHIGRTSDLTPSSRGQMSYTVTDKLFDLVAVHYQSPEHIRLAQAAAPYLILRTSLTLKAYVFDQPLRGRMPQPASQRKELLYIVDKLVQLESEPRAIPNASSIESKYKKHLYRMHPLIVRALAVTKSDSRLQASLLKALDTMSQDFRV